MQHPFKRHDRHTGYDYVPHALQLQPPPVQLEIVRGRAQCRLRPVDVPAFLIGSAYDCDLVLGDARFPQVHAYLRLVEGQVLIRHLGFQPELAVNGHVVSKAVLSHGDRIETGPYEFQTHIRSPLPPGSPPLLPAHAAYQAEELCEWIDESLPHEAAPADWYSVLAPLRTGPMLRVHPGCDGLQWHSGVEPRGADRPDAR